MKLTDKELEEYAKSVKAREYEKYCEECRKVYCFEIN